MAEPVLEDLLARVATLQEGNTQLWRNLIEDRKRISELEKRLGARPPTAPRTGKVKKAETIFVNHGNCWMTFSDIGKMMGWPPETRRQNMSKLAAVFQQHPERYEVKPSKLGGKAARLKPEYLNHILKEGV